MFNHLIPNRLRTQPKRHGTLCSIARSRTLAAMICELDDEALRYHVGFLARSTTATEEHAMAFAIEAVRRTMGMDVYDVQLQAALAIARGEIAEMQTGEGKTLTGLVAAIIHGLQSRHVHVATTNEYLARRDYELLSPALQAVGLTAGLSVSDQDTAQTQAAYRCSVVFATGYQFGFDYLRDQLTLAKRPRYQLGQRFREQLQGTASGDDDLCQRGHDVVIIDEVDSVLIDEAMTPLVLSGACHPSNATEPSNALDLARRCAETLEVDIDFSLAPDNTPSLTPNGIARSQEYWQHAEDAVNLEFPGLHYIQTALHARYSLHRDIDYVVRDGAVQIVDASTGRIVPDRQWRSGLHQAVETKEHLARTETRETMARISRQRYFARYHTRSGMTGTAGDHQHEWKTVYGLDVQPIPTRLPSRRSELPTLYVANDKQKLLAIVDEAKFRMERGQPVLIGTRTIEQTRLVSKALLHAQVNHRLLNGVQDEAEAELISVAGRSGSLTVATNMAGRGTDIVLDQSAVIAGGLHVIGFERNHSHRIDRQLLGRAARQGQPGSGRFFVSPEDELASRYSPSLAKALSGLKQPTSNPAWDRRVAAAQASSERERYESRQQTAQQEEWLNGLRQHVA